MRNAMSRFIVVLVLAALTPACHYTVSVDDASDVATAQWTATHMEGEQPPQAVPLSTRKLKSLFQMIDARRVSAADSDVIANQKVLIEGTFERILATNSGSGPQREFPGVRLGAKLSESQCNMLTTTPDKPGGAAGLFNLITTQIQGLLVLVRARPNEYRGFDDAATIESFNQVAEFAIGCNGAVAIRMKGHWDKVHFWQDFVITSVKAIVTLLAALAGVALLDEIATFDDIVTAHDAIKGKSALVMTENEKITSLANKALSEWALIAVDILLKLKDEVAKLDQSKLDAAAVVGVVFAAVQKSSLLAKLKLGNDKVKLVADAVSGFVSCVLRAIAPQQLKQEDSAKYIAAINSALEFMIEGARIVASIPG